MATQLSRRRFTGLSLAASTTGLLPPRLARGAPKMELIRTRVISMQTEFYHGWPTVTRTTDGILHLCYSGHREGHICPFGTVDMMSSYDDGKTWTYPRTIHDGPLDDRDSGVMETAERSLIVTSFSSLAYLDLMNHGSAMADKPRWKAARERIPDEKLRQSELGEWCFRSTDGGLSFSGRIPTLVNSPHGPCQLNDGCLLYVGKQLWTAEKKVGVSVSRDDGRSWHWLAEIPAREGDLAREYHELHAVQCLSGRIIAHIRNHNSTNHGETLQTESEDGGKTWSVPHEIGVWGLPSHLLKLRNGLLLMTYGHRRMPFGNQVRLSEDEGRTWSEPLVISGDGIGGDLGYPSTVETADGTLLTVWYELLAGSPHAQLRQAHWRLTS